MKYSLNREGFASDEEFANFRYIECGNIKADKLFRSASPVDNANNRAPYVSSLIGSNDIDYVFDLSNNAAKQAEYASDPSVGQDWKDLYNAGHVLDVKVDPNFYSDAYLPKMKFLAETMAEVEGKCLFHCAEGKDRMGFVAILLESLCGATIKEITDDYFVTYTNYYHITEEKDPEKISLYKTLKLYEMTNIFAGEGVNERATVEQLSLGAKNYLLRAGVSSENIDKLINQLTK